MKHKAITLIEALIISVIVAVVTLSTIDIISKMFVAENTFNEDITSQENKTAVTEKIITAMMPGSYLYRVNTPLIIPTKIGNTEVYVGTQTVAVLCPEFASDGSLIMPTTGTTTFTGTAFSIIPETTWNGGKSGKYVLIQTILNDQSLNLAVDPNDTLKINIDPPTNWSQGKSFIIATNLKPGQFSNLTNVFTLNSQRNSLQFAFVPTASGLYFPSPNSSQPIDDSKFISSVNLRNWRETTY